MKNPKALMVGLLTVVCLAVVGFAAAAQSSQSPSVEVETDADDLPVEALLPVTSGSEPAVFGSAVSAADQGADIAFGDVAVTVHPREDNGNVCLTIKRAETTENTCADTELIRSGLAYSAVRGHDGPIEIVGLVPDGIESIRIDGKDVPVVDNVWYTTADDGADLSFSVVDSSGRTAVLSGN